MPETAQLADFPEEIRKKLREPLPPEAIKPHPSKSYMSSVNSMYIVERLNDVFGENGWTEEYTVIDAPKDSAMVVVFCVLGFPNYRTDRKAFGGNDNRDRGDAYKGACTDALTKAASKIGIAADVYKGMHDIPPADENGKGKRGQRESAKRTYEHVQGVVTEYNRMAENCLWIQISGVAFKIEDPLLIKKLANCQGKQVQLNAYWSTIGKSKRPIMIVSAVHGVYESVPSKEFIRAADEQHAEMEEENARQRATWNQDLVPALKESIEQAKAKRAAKSEMTESGVPIDFNRNRK